MSDTRSQETEIDMTMPGDQDARGNPRYLPPIPEHILRRHNARLLDPTAAAPDNGHPGASPTVYRPRTLLVPDDVRRSQQADLDRVLGELNLELDAPAPGRGNRPRPVRLRVKDSTRPASVDAWRAVQQVRRNLRDKAAAGRVGLEHLMLSATWAGTEGAYTPSNPPGGAAASSLSYVWSRGSGGRLPVVVTAAAPRRERDLSRRPVVAVLDAGISPHPWLDVESGCTPDGSGFVAVDEQLQKLVSDNHGGRGSMLPLSACWERPVGKDLVDGSETLLGELDTHWGHGTFITGLVRQAEPEAQVLAIRVMYSDGVAYESDVLCALEALENRVRRAQEEGRPDLMVDVVVLSLGYYPEDLTVDPPVSAYIERLAELGVLVCASAGNGSTMRRFYPAALADQPSCGQLLLSVGSLNPNRSKALFSNDGPWVQRWAPGAAVVSTFPKSAGSIGPRHTMVAEAPVGQPQRREAMDNDDFSNGFALWSGTSFAAPLVAARLVTLLLDGGQETLATVTAEATRARAINAVNDLPDYVWPR